MQMKNSKLGHLHLALDKKKKSSTMPFMVNDVFPKECRKMRNDCSLCYPRTPIIGQCP
jgi:hypothetical protein